MLSNSLTIEESRSLLYSRTATLIFKSCVIIALQISLTDLNCVIGIFGGLFSITCITHTFQILIFIITAIILLLTGFYARRIVDCDCNSKLYISDINDTIVEKLNLKSKESKIIEYPLLLLFIITGGVFLMSSSDVISLFISIELQSYGLYLLTAINRNNELATSAALLYFLLGGLSSCIILLGTGLLYVNYGSTSLDSYYVITSLSGIAEQGSNNLHSLYNINYVNMSLLIVSVGFLFKISAAPFHFWSPDVYDAVPTVTTTFLAVVSKISLLIFLLELVHYSAYNNMSDIKWTHALLISSFLSLIIGTILGLNQYRIKRILAYSAISHIGFILLSISINSLESTQAFIFYLIQYSITNLNIFIIILGIGYTFFLAKSVQSVDDLDNYFRKNPFLALSFAITIFSLVGVPPLMGFFGKQLVLSAALDSGYIFLSLIAILTSVISAVYYLNLVKRLFFTKKTLLYPYLIHHWLLVKKSMDIKNNLGVYTSEIRLSSTLSITISILTLIILLFIFCSQQLLSLSNLLGIILYN